MNVIAAFDALELTHRPHHHQVLLELKDPSIYRANRVTGEESHH
jgi:transcriptional antiterminator Rof (Rho-off)